MIYPTVLVAMAGNREFRTPARTDRFTKCIQTIWTVTAPAGSEIARRQSSSSFECWPSTVLLLEVLMCGTAMGDESPWVTTVCPS